jgi:hypothetical protein
MDMGNKRIDLFSLILSNGFVRISSALANFSLVFLFASLDEMDRYGLETTLRDLRLLFRV